MLSMLTNVSSEFRCTCPQIPAQPLNSYEILYNYFNLNFFVFASLKMGVMTVPSSLSFSED